MTRFTVALIGTGPHPDTAEGHEGYSMGYRHAQSYQTVDGCRLVACADIDAANASAFAEEFGIPEDSVFEDYRQMLEAADPDIVGICTPPATHLDLITGCAEYDSVRAIHCEKPMAPTWGESTAMVDVCERTGTQLTFNFQGTAGPSAEAITNRIADGEIGELTRVELSRSNLLQTGIHRFAFANHVVGNSPVEWVIGQVDFREKTMWYTGMYSEDQGLGQRRYENGVHGFATTGVGADGIGVRNRFIGTDGMIELDRTGPSPRIRRGGDAEWVAIDTADERSQDRAIEDAIRSLETGETPVLDGTHALAATEIVFAIWESARRRGRVDCPLAIEANPLEAMIEGTASESGRR